MKEVRVTCRNQEEFSEIIEIARKEGCRWIGGSGLSGFKPTCNYPYDIIFRNCLAYTTAVKECSYSVKEFVSDYNIDHAEAFGISQEVKNEIILDFMKKWHEIREGCDKRSCYNCKFNEVKYGCKLDNVDDCVNEETFLEAVKLLMDVVDSGDARILRLTPNEAVEVIRKEIKSLHGKEDDETQGIIEALKMAVIALEERKDGFGAESD